MESLSDDIVCFHHQKLFDCIRPLQWPKMQIPKYRSDSFFFLFLITCAGHISADLDQMRIALRPTSSNSFEVLTHYVDRDVNISRRSSNLTCASINHFIRISLVFR